MKVFEDVNIPARTEKRCKMIACDFCDKQVRGDGWEESSFDIDETEISVTINHRAGKAYGEDSYGDRFHCDMCPECFRQRLYPFLLNIAINPLDYEDWDI